MNNDHLDCGHETPRIPGQIFGDSYAWCDRCRCWVPIKRAQKEAA